MVEIVDNRELENYDKISVDYELVDGVQIKDVLADVLTETIFLLSANCQ